MDDIFALCAFKTPAEGAEDALSTILGAGMPVNIKVGELREETEFDLEAGLGHLVCEYATPEQVPLAKEFLRILFEFGFNWMLLDGQQRTPGEIAYARGLTELYQMFVDAGVRSEIVLQKLVEDCGSEFESDEAPDAVETDGAAEASGATGAAEVTGQDDDAPVEGTQSKFLVNKLKFSEHTLETDEQDGVMMDWEKPIMERSAELVTKPGGTVLNIGFGMGIIDTFIQERKPAKHYIVEAHPEVLAHMKQTGWYDKPNVVVLEGPWKTQLPKLLDEQVQLDGIYYDTFSEHYRDMLELFDSVVGLLSFDGTFSYFNGLGADRQVCYDVYKQVAMFNLKDYGLEVEYETMPITLPSGTWDSIKREYFKLDSYALPIIRFAGELEDEEGDLVPQ